MNKIKDFKYITTAEWLNNLPKIQITAVDNSFYVITVGKYILVPVKMETHSEAEQFIKDYQMELYLELISLINIKTKENE